MQKLNIDHILAKRLRWEINLQSQEHLPLLKHTELFKGEIPHFADSDLRNI